MSPDRFTVDALLAHEGLVRGLARSILKGDDRVEDVVQETFATALRTSPRDPGALGRWLGTISRRLALRVRGGDESRGRRESATRGRSAVPTPAEITEREETRRAVLTALLDLDPLYRDALLLRFYEDLPPREVAANLGVPVETARSRIKRGIASLRRTLRARYGEQKRALPLALVLLAETARPGAVPTFLGMKAALMVITLVGAGMGVVALVRPAPAPPVHPSAAVHGTVPAHPPSAPPTPAGVDEVIPARPAPVGRNSGFAGMAAIPNGKFAMGIDEKTLIKLYGAPNKNPTLRHHKLLTEKEKLIWWNLLLLETPEHDVDLGPYALDVFTVTNAQYRQFLENSQRTSFHTKERVNTIALVAREVYGEERLDDWLAESIFWINEKKLLGSWEEIHRANEPRIEAILKEFNTFRPETARIRDFLLLPDKQRAEGWVKFLLPERLRLTVYERPIPDHWLRPVPDEEQEKSTEYVPRRLLTKNMESWPVVWVTAEDADAFAAWAGKHVPTEEEYEKAARGPEGWLYPWGNTWNWHRDRNFLVWRYADPWPKGPAAPYKDRAVDVTRCAAYASPYGVMHMLGNVREWTSSRPGIYPGSTATEYPWHGTEGYRVIRSTSYGDGNTSGDGRKLPFLELMHRNTARALEGPGGAGISVTARYPAVGFRCAKYPQPARDVLAYHLARCEEDGSLFPKLGLDLPRTLGMEQIHEAPDAADQVFVVRRTRAIGFVPVRKVVERDGLEVLGWLWWNANVKLALAGGGTLESTPGGYLVCLREGIPGLYVAAARGPKAVGLQAKAGQMITHPDDTGLTPGLTESEGNLVFRLDYAIDGAHVRLVLPLTFTGPGLPDDTWRR